MKLAIPKASTPVTGPTPRQLAFEQAVHAFKTELFRYAYGLTRDRFAAEDLVQETFVRAWKAWDSLDKESSRKFWLMTILRNENARRFARKAPEFVSTDGDDALELPSRLIPDSTFDLENLVQMLPPAFREPLLLQVLGGFSCAEIASLLRTTEGAIMTRLSRARQALRKALRTDSTSAHEPAE